MGDHKTTSTKKEETEGVPNEPGFMFLEVPGLPIKPDPELNQDVEGSENNVVASTRCASNKIRLTENSGESCNISFKETVMERLVPSVLEIHEEESTHHSKFDTHTQRLEEAAEEEEEEEEEESLYGNRLTCRWKETEFRKFTCNFCLQNFGTKYRLTIHVFSHMNGVQPPKYICKSCGDIFSSDIGLNKHFEDQTSSAGRKQENMFLEDDPKFSFIDNAPKLSSSPLKTLALRDTGTKCHKCVGSKSVTNLVDVKKHALPPTRMKGYKCVCDKLGHLRNDTTMRPHTCDVCGKSFSHMGDFNKHTLTHTGMRPHKCDVCGKSFIRQDGLKRHSLLHTGMRPHKCDVCGKSFSEFGNLKKHILTHSGIRPHKCDVCGKSFSMLSNLKRHILSHTGMRPHKCRVCGKSFAQLRSVKRHALTHVGERHHTNEMFVASHFMA